jgi:hypothetical protein
VKSTRNFVGILAALVLVAGGLYGIQQINAGENCTAATTAKATSEKGDAKVETANATTTSAGCCAAKAGSASAACPTQASCGSHATKVETANATVGTQCTYNAKTASAQCAPGTAAQAEVMTAEATMAKLSHCGIDCRKADAQVLAAKLANSQCGSYTQEQWATMIKSAQALDAKQADAIFASATSEKPCAGDACPMKKVAAEMAAAQNEEKKESTN